MTRLVVATLIAISAAMPVQAAQWRVNYGKSKLGFTVPWQDQSFDGQFKSWNAVIEFDPSDLTHSKASIRIDLASVASGEADTDANIKGPQGFDTTRFSTAKFDASSFRTVGNGRYVAQGILDLHGIKKPVSASFTFMAQDRSAHVTGTADVMRTDFGIGLGQFAQDAPVGRKVRVKFDLTAIRQP